MTLLLWLVGCVWVSDGALELRLSDWDQDGVTAAVDCDDGDPQVAECDSGEPIDTDDSGDTAADPEDPNARVPVTAFSTISSGSYAACGVTADNTIACWGYELFQPGAVVPPEPQPGDAPWVQLSTAGIFVCGRTSSKRVECWGSNLNAVMDVPAFDFAQISAGRAHVCGITSNGELICWGESASGNDQDVVAEQPEGDLVVHVGSGDGMACVERPNSGGRYCWGSGFPFPETTAGLEVPDPYDSFWGCALQSGTGAVHCDHAQTGDSVRMSDDAPYLDVCSGNSFWCARDANRKAHCGGTGTLGWTVDIPDRVYTELSCGNDYACGLGLHGAVDCWGGDLKVIAATPE